MTKKICMVLFLLPRLQRHQCAEKCVMQVPVALRAGRCDSSLRVRMDTTCLDREVEERDIPRLGVAPIGGIREIPWCRQRAACMRQARIMPQHDGHQFKYGGIPAMNEFLEP